MPRKTKKSSTRLIYNKNVISLRCGSEKWKTTMKWNELRRYAENRGWKFLRNGKKHEIYYHPDKPYQIQLERHNSAEVKKGIMLRLLKLIG